MVIGVYANLMRDIGGEVTKRICEGIAKLGINCVCCDELVGVIPNAQFLSKAELAKVSDILIILGGDGTILRVVQDCAANNTKILAINLGHVGFLTEMEKLDETAINRGIMRLLKGDFQIDKRDLMQITHKDIHYNALNEVVVARGCGTRMVSLSVSVNDSFVEDVYADGVTICTPTGSTAYSLSAGGPIIAPDVNVFCITPICAHSLKSRPIVVSNNSSITVTLNKADSSASLSLDGDDIAKMEVGEQITIEKSTLYAEFIRFEGYDFYCNLMKKLNYWGIEGKE